MANLHKIAFYENERMEYRFDYDWLCDKHKDGVMSTDSLNTKLEKSITELNPEENCNACTYEPPKNDQSIPSAGGQIGKPNSDADW